VTKLSSTQIVVTDLDDTLWFNGVVPQRTKDALAALKRRGIPVLAATARRPASTLLAMKLNNILLPAVLFNGSLGLDFATNSIFHERIFDPDISLTVLGTLATFDIEPCVNVRHPTHDVVVGNAPSTHRDHLAFIKPWTRVSDLYDVARSEPVLSIGVCGLDGELLRRAAAAIDHVAATTVSRDGDFGNFTLSVRPLGVTKWAGVVAYSASHHLDANCVLAVGDGQNDVELLTNAAVGCASVGACSEVIEASDYDLGAFKDGGWHSILDLVD
jgi:hydroxymethylpyrimidine pyrophosphatase-like HAD family hydrolase